jgi:hypothetical protein
MKTSTNQIEKLNGKHQQYTSPGKERILKTEDKVEELLLQLAGMERKKKKLSWPQYPRSLRHD